MGRICRGVSFKLLALIALAPTDKENLGDVAPQDKRMEQLSVERRREPRYPIQAKVMIKKDSGQTIPAMALDISSSGMRLHIDQHPCPLCLNENVTIEIELPDIPDKPLSAWGVGRVAHIGSGMAGIQLVAGHFHPLPLHEGAD